MGDGLKPELAEWLTERTLVGECAPVRAESRRAGTPEREAVLVRESFLAPLAEAFSRHEAKLTRYAARITGDADSARDVVQDVFARLCREPPADLNGQLAPWLYAACRNRAIDVRRKDSRMSHVADAELFAMADGCLDSAVGERCQASRRRNEDPARRESAQTQAIAKDQRPSVDPAAEAASRDESAKVLRLLSQMPGPQQEAVCLRFSCGLSYKEIAAVMELSVSHVGVLLHTAIAALRERMKDVN